MKKRYNILIVTGILCSLVSLSSCDMDKRPYDEIPVVIESVSDVDKLITTHYYYMKGTSSGTSVIWGEIASDQFQPVSNYSNDLFQFVRWEVEPGTAEIYSYWYDRYSYINDVNFLIKGIADLDKTNLTTAQVESLNLHLGEAHFFRASYYFDLVRRYSKKYVRETATAEGSGVMLLTEPLSPPGVSIPRSTLQEVYDLIWQDLETAGELITVAGKPNSYYLTADIVKALKARIALEAGDYATAYNEATALIESGTYALTNDREAFKGMWVLDDNIPGEAWDDVTYTIPQKELMMVTQVTGPADNAGTLGQLFVARIPTAGSLSPQFFPTQTSLDQFDAEADIRFPAYFEEKSYEISGTGSDDIYFFMKFPGNRTLESDASTYSNYRQKGKPFRIAEQYLIAAEAAFFKGDESNANIYLNELRANRIEEWGGLNYSGTNLLDEIKFERFRELYGEGFRFFDLKRWGDGFVRGEVQSDILVNSDDILSHIEILGGDYRFTWPIPIGEMDQNAAIREQQNEGY